MLSDDEYIFIMNRHVSQDFHTKRVAHVSEELKEAFASPCVPVDVHVGRADLTYFVMHLRLRNRSMIKGVDVTNMLFVCLQTRALSVIFGVKN